MDIAIMVEGQNGLNWPRWQRLAHAVEELGFAGLYRSDHYTNSNPPDLDSLELWVSLTWLASHTRRIEFGPLVSPLSFRHPTLTARMAAAVDDLSGGRLRLGLGAGWQEREHTNYGWDLLSIPERLDRFQEGLEVITRLLKSAQPVNFSGRYYRVQEAIVLPRPARPQGPPIVIGGNGEKRTLPLVARYADEWNAVLIAPQEFERLNAYLSTLILKEGRKPEEVRRTLMTGCIFAGDSLSLEKIVSQRYQNRYTVEALRQRGIVAATPEDIREVLSSFLQAGVQRIMLQWLDLDDIDGLEMLARAIFSTAA
jgi:F420-dependent oxidoreductase-like protein